MSDLPLLGRTKHKHCVYRIAVQADALESIFIALEQWIEQQVLDPPRSADEWRAAGFQYQQLISNGKSAIRLIDKETQTIQEIIRNAPR